MKAIWRPREMDETDVKQWCLAMSEIYQRAADDPATLTSVLTLLESHYARSGARVTEMPPVPCCLEHQLVGALRMARRT